MKKTSEEAKRASRIRSLAVNEISLCARPANPFAEVKFAKHADAPEGAARLLKVAASKARELRAQASGQWEACTDCPDPRICGAGRRCKMEVGPKRVAKSDATPAERLVLAAEARAAELVRRRG